MGRPSCGLEIVTMAVYDANDVSCGLKLWTVMHH